MCEQVFLPFFVQKGLYLASKQSWGSYFTENMRCLILVEKF